MSRGDHQEDIFAGSPDRQLFLDTLEEACPETDWQIHAFCLMSNHFRLVVETPKANLVEGMKWLLGTYMLPTFFSPYFGPNWHCNGFGKVSALLS